MLRKAATPLQEAHGVAGGMDTGLLINVDQSKRCREIWGTRCCGKSLATHDWGVAAKVKGT